MKYVFSILVLACIGCGISAQQHALNAKDAAEYQADVLICAVKPNCHEYLACKCEKDRKFNFDSGACEGKFQDGTRCE